MSSHTKKEVAKSVSMRPPLTDIKNFDHYVKTAIPNQVIYLEPESDNWCLVCYPGESENKFYLMDLQSKSTDGGFFAYLVDNKGKVAKNASHIVFNMGECQITRLVTANPKHLSDLGSLEKIKARIRENKNDFIWRLDDGWEIVAYSIVKADTQVTRYYLVDRFAFVGRGAYGSVFSAYLLEGDGDLESPDFGKIDDKHPFVLKASQLLGDPHNDIFFNYYKVFKDCVDPEKDPAFPNFLDAVRKLYKIPSITPEELVAGLKNPEHGIHKKYLKKAKDIDEQTQQIKRDTKAYNVAVGFAEEPFFLKDSTKCYQMMERINGISLRKFDTLDLTFKDRLDLVIQFFNILRSYHGSGFIHFDIKNTNVLICDEKRSGSKSKYRLTLFDPITQDHEVQSYEDLNTLRPLQRQLKIQPRRNGVSYHSDESINRDEKGEPLLDEKGNFREGLVGAKTDIDMARREIVRPIFQDLLFSEYPEIRGKKIRFYMNEFSNRMSLEYDARPDLLEVQRFYQSIYILTEVQKEIDRLKEDYENHEENKGLIKSYEKTITINFAKLILIHSKLWNVEYISKESALEAKESNLKAKKSIVKNYDFERHVIISEVILVLFEMENLNESTIRFVLGKASRKIDSADKRVFDKIIELLNKKDNRSRYEELMTLTQEIQNNKKESSINVPGTKFHRQEPIPVKAPEKTRYEDEDENEYALCVVM